MGLVRRVTWKETGIKSTEATSWKHLGSEQGKRKVKLLGRQWRMETSQWIGDAKRVTDCWRGGISQMPGGFLREGRGKVSGKSSEVQDYLPQLQA